MQEEMAPKPPGEREEEDEAFRANCHKLNVESKALACEVEAVPNTELLVLGSSE